MATPTHKTARTKKAPRPQLRPGTEPRRNYRNEATLRGIRPKRGLWIVHPGMGRAYGQIHMVRSDGTVVWKGARGVLVPTNPSTLVELGYAYAGSPAGFAQRILGAQGDTWEVLTPGDAQHYYAKGAR